MGCSIVTPSPSRPVGDALHTGHDQRYQQTAQSSSALWVGPACPMTTAAEGSSSGPLSLDFPRPRRSPRPRSFSKGGPSQPLVEPDHDTEGGNSHRVKGAMGIHKPEPEDSPISPGQQTPLVSPCKGPTSRLGESMDREYDGSASEVEDLPLLGRRRPRNHATTEALEHHKADTETRLPVDPALHKAKHRSVVLPHVLPKSSMDLSAGFSVTRPHHLHASSPPSSQCATSTSTSLSSPPPIETRGMAGQPPPKLAVTDWRGAMQAEIVHLAQHAQAVEHRLAVLMDAHQKLLQEPGPEDFLCPILREVMIDPVVTSDGHTYERSAIAEWFSRRNTSPLTNQPLTDLRLIPNHALRRQIMQWRERAQVQGDPERPTSVSVPTKHPSLEEPESLSSAMTSPSNNTTSLANTAASDFSFRPHSLQPSVSASLSVDSEDTTSSASYLSQVTAGSAVEAAATIVAPAPTWPFSTAPADDSPSERSCLPDSMHSYRSARSEFSTQSSRPPTAP